MHLCILCSLGRSFSIAFSKWSTLFWANEILFKKSSWPCLRNTAVFCHIFLLLPASEWPKFLWVRSSDPLANFPPNPPMDLAHQEYPNFAQDFYNLSKHSKHNIGSTKWSPVNFPFKSLTRGKSQLRPCSSLISMQEQAVQDSNGRFKLAALSTQNHLNAKMHEVSTFSYGYTFLNSSRVW